MAKNMLPMQSGGGLLGKVIGALVLLALLALVVKHPTEAATFAKSTGHAIGSAIDGISSFLGNVVG